MILQALCSYYQRASAGNEEVAALGYATAGAAAELVIDGTGNLVAVNSLLQESGKKQVPKLMVVPQPPKRSGSKPEPAFLYETVGFLFGIYDKPEGAIYRFEASREKHEKILAGCTDPGAQALLSFFEKRTMGSINYPGVDTTLLKKPMIFVVFRLAGDTVFLHERPMIRTCWETYCAQNTAGKEQIQCLVTGQKAPLAVIHGNVSGFGTDKPTLVGFNQESFCSFGQYGRQGANAPVGEQAAFEYVTALNMLMRDRRHRFQLSKDKVLFWAERDAPAEENALALCFGADPGAQDATTENAPQTRRELDAAQAARIRGLLESTTQGGTPDQPALDPNVNFYLLGLCANKTRLVIRFFYTSTFGALRDNLARHYRDIAVVGMKYPYPSPYRLLLETALDYKADNVAPNLDAALMLAILNGTPYPLTLYQAVLRRVRAEHTLTPFRAGILKAVLNRQANKEVITVALDKNETDTAYLLGRLFAVLERGQYLALGDVNATITDKYLNSALATPQMVFPTLLALNSKHISKMMGDKTGAAVNVSKDINEIMGGLQLQESANVKFAFPPSLDVNGQGKFLLGYYHQAQSYYEKAAAKADKDEAVTTQQG